jgi:hypothetical protein
MPKCLVCSQSFESRLPQIACASCRDGPQSSPFGFLWFLGVLAVLVAVTYWLSGAT